MADKREGRRIIKRLRLTFLCGDEEYKGISSNFSDSGLFIKTRKRFKPGSSVNIILELEDIQKIIKI
jgi:Tfp pilus assembly protein PilZ